MKALIRIPFQDISRVEWHRKSNPETIVSHTFAIGGILLLVLGGVALYVFSTMSFNFNWFGD